MPELPTLIIILSALTVIFMFIGRSKRANSNEGAASVNYTIGFMLLIVVVMLIILFFVMNANVQSVEETQHNESITAPP